MSGSAPAPFAGKRGPLPGPLAGLDDERGVVWRAYRLARSFRPRRAGRFAIGYARGVRHERPVFVVGPPRSGTTSIHRLLTASRELGSLPSEGNGIWRAYHHPRLSGWDSDAVGEGRVGPGERRFVGARLFAHFDCARFVEKTPENSLRIPHLLELFPDAAFIAMQRDPCETIGSIMNGWRDPAGRFRTYFVPEDLEIPGYPHRRRWCFTLVDGWRDLKRAPIHQIAFAQWEQSIRGLLAGRDLVTPDRWLDLTLEDLVGRPDESLDAICRVAKIERTCALRFRLERLLDRPPNAGSPPRTGKWAEEHRDELLELLPRIADVAAAAGYRMDVATGESERPAFRLRSCGDGLAGGHREHWPDPGRDASQRARQTDPAGGGGRFCRL